MSGIGSSSDRKTFGTSSRGSTNNPRATSSTICQKCLQTGHFTYQCKFKRPYMSRPSRTQLLEKPELLAKIQPLPVIPDEFKSKSGVANKILEAKEEARQKKRKRSESVSSSSSSSSSSGSNSALVPIREAAAADQEADQGDLALASGPILTVPARDPALDPGVAYLLHSEGTRGHHQESARRSSIAVGEVR
ncbi:hypothetical protein FRB94_007718 [Tulasnella sp. JGI-2019a]|nr:hypothetical protein FRB94_007718 [Tulasnella sp. JGI-2019a]